MSGNVYSPDKWVVIKFPSNFRLFGTWSGSYLYGESWRANSGIKNVTEDGDYFLFHGASGSIYKCHKEMYGIAGDGYNASFIWDREILPEETDWINFDWGIEENDKKNSR